MYYSKQTGRGGDSPAPVITWIPFSIGGYEGIFKDAFVTEREKKSKLKTL
jgi:hypothetical protein